MDLVIKKIMLKQKLILFITYGIILNYFGDSLKTLPQLFTPLLYLGFGSLLYQIEAILIFLSFLYLGLSSLLYPYKEDRILLKIIAVFFLITLLPSFIQINTFPSSAIIKFLFSCIPFFIVLIFLVKGMVKTDN